MSEEGYEKVIEKMRQRRSFVKMGTDQYSRTRIFITLERIADALETILDKNHDIKQGLRAQRIIRPL